MRTTFSPSGLRTLYEFLLRNGGLFICPLQPHRFCNFEIHGRKELWPTASLSNKKHIEYIKIIVNYFKMFSKTTVYLAAHNIITILFFTTIRYYTITERVMLLILQSTPCTRSTPNLLLLVSWSKPHMKAKFIVFNSIFYFHFRCQTFIQHLVIFQRSSHNSYVQNIRSACGPFIDFDKVYHVMSRLFKICN